MPSLRALVVADKESAYIWDYFDRNVFSGIDVIISCGDLKASYLSYLVTMIPAPLLYVHGNHDGSYLRNPPLGCDCLDDRIITIKGVRFFGLSGCKSHSPKPFHYTEKEMTRLIVRRMPDICLSGGFDVMVTHSPAFGLGDGDDLFHQGFLCYKTLLDQFSPGYHLHGHQHLDYGGVRQQTYQSTTIMNGCGYRLLELTVPDAPKKHLSYIKTRYDWGKNYAAILSKRSVAGV